jgi:DNA-damage-inducible protein D
MKKDLAIFEGHEIRRVYDESTATWWFSVVDIIRVLTQQPHYQAAQNYWKVLKHRLNQEGSQLVANCNQLKMTAADGMSNSVGIAKKHYVREVTKEWMEKFWSLKPTP